MRQNHTPPCLDWRCCRSIGLMLLLLSFSSSVFAVAGGAGGGSSGGGGGDGDLGFLFDILIWLIFHIPFPFNLIVLAIIVAIVFYARSEVRGISRLNSIPASQQLPEAASGNPIAMPASLLKRNPDFTPDSLLAKVRTAFPAIQEAWSAQNLSSVRRWISDGVWQRFNTQFAMMKLLGQRNIVSNVCVQRAWIDAVEEDGDYDIVHVGIHFVAQDDFVSDKLPELNQCGKTALIEFWSFMRKAGIAAKDLYHSNACPSCGAELPSDMGEVAQCPACKTVSTLGDYDWVLCEITQADDYRNQNTKLGKSGKLTLKLRDALRVGKDFAVQSIEDKASNAYLQILAAQVLQKPEMMRRFVSDAVFESAQRPASEMHCIFNRLYLNNVTAIDAYRAEGKNHVVVAVKRTAQRVMVEGEKLRVIDRGLYAIDQILILSRDEEGTGNARASLYAHACPACGAPVADTLDVKCTYCGEVLNSTSREWIVTQLLSPAEYRQLATSQKSQMATKVSGDDLDPLYALRDYVFNNVLMMIGIDGELSDEEMTFARELARRFGYKEDKLAGIFELAKNRKLVLRLPSTRKAAQKVLAQMEKAANADNRITPEEKALLDDVRIRVEAIWAE